MQKFKIFDDQNPRHKKKILINPNHPVSSIWRSPERSRIQKKKKKKLNLNLKKSFHIKIRIKKKNQIFKIKKINMQTTKTELSIKRNKI